MCHPTPDASKNMKFRLSENPTKFDEVTIFHETNSTVKSVLSSEIYKIFGFQPKLPFYHFLENLNFSPVLQSILNYKEKLWTKSIDLVKMYQAQGEFEQSLNSIKQR